MDALPITLTAICERVDRVRVDRIQDARIRRLPFQQKIGAGLTPEQFAEKVKALQRAPRRPHRVGGDDRGRARLEARPHHRRDQAEDRGRQPVESQFLKVPAGRVCGIVQDGIGYVGGEPRITLHMEAYLGAPETYDSVEIEGSPRLHVKALGGYHGDVATASITVNTHPEAALGCTGPAHHAQPRAAVVRRREVAREMRRRAFLRRTGAASLLAAAPPAWSWAAGDAPWPKPVRPRRLKAGDRVGLVAPASANFQSVDIEIAQEVARAFSLEPRLGAHVRDRHGYLAGRDEDRAADVNGFFADASVSALFAIRGGWGCARVLPLIDWDLVRRNPKVVTGYSDITALHCALHAKTGLVSFHAPTLLSGWPPFSVENFRRVVFEGEAVTMANPPGDEERLVQRENRTRTITPGTARGRLLGGNLTVLTALMGSPYLPGLRRRDPVPRGRARGHLPRRPHADASSRSPACSASCAASCSAPATSASPARATARSRSRRCSTSTCGRSACRRTRAP